MLLTIEVTRTETPTSVEVAICFDDDGLDELVRLLSRLKGRRPPLLPRLRPGA